MHLLVLFHPKLSYQKKSDLFYYSAIDDFTFVKVLNEDEEWLLKAEKIQRSKQPYSRKICKQIPQTVMEGIMQYAKEFRNDGKIVWCVTKKRPQSIVSKLKNKQK